MPKAQCYYEILGVSGLATSDEIKKAYRNLALVWHPDKNQSNLDEAHAKFQTILKAYETLSDSREREWYDRHKDQILSDGDKNSVECLNLFQFFSSACYANFDDSEDGFYTVYKKVFEDIAKEEEKALDRATKYNSNNRNKGKTSYDKDVYNRFPSFGNSKSSYEVIVRPFYAFWSGFCTNLTFDHLDKYNTLEADNRRILRAMEKENKKVKDAARKERNLNIRNLIEFIRKRDKRLKAHKLQVEQQNELNRKKTSEKQRQQREKSLKEKLDYKPADWQDMDDFEEQLRQLESEYVDLNKRKNRKGRSNQRNISDVNDENLITGVLDDDEQTEVNGEGDKHSAISGAKTIDSNVDTHSINKTDKVDSNDDNLRDDEEEFDDDEEENFFCPACNKDFRSINAFENHEASKKHKQNVLKLTKLLKDEERKLNK